MALGPGVRVVVPTELDLRFDVPLPRPAAWVVAVRRGKQPWRHRWLRNEDMSGELMLRFELCRNLTNNATSWLLSCDCRSAAMASSSRSRDRYSVR